MTTFLQERPGAAVSGTNWGMANGAPWQSTRPDVVLFAPKQPRLAESSTNNRHRVGVQRAQKPDGSAGI